MRWFAIILTSLMFSLTARAEMIGAQADTELCQAAVTDSALPARVDDLMEADRFTFSDVTQMLAIQCQGGSMLEVMLEERQAENLEFAVIDLGLDLHQPLATAAGRLSLVEWLNHQADSHHNAEVRDFARAYLKRFRDEEFNPNLLVSAQ
jgi:hypothetical protein